MDIKYLKTQGDLADILIDRIDRYWKLELKEEQFVDEITDIAANNSELLYKDGGYTSIVSHKLGKKRLNLLEKILEKRGE